MHVNNETISVAERERMLSSGEPYLDEIGKIEALFVQAESKKKGKLTIPEMKEILKSLGYLK